MDDTSEPSEVGDSGRRTLFSSSSNQRAGNMAVGGGIDQHSSQNSDEDDNDGSSGDDNDRPEDDGSNSGSGTVGGSPQRLPRSPQPMCSPSPRKILNLEEMEDDFEEGYDSDGYKPDCVNDEEDEAEDEQALPLLADTNQADNTPTAPEAQDPRHVPIESGAFEKLTIKDLKYELTIREIQYPSQSKKDALQERLKIGLEKKLPVRIFGEAAQDLREGKKKKKTAVTGKKADDLTGFAPGCYWETLTAMTATVEEPDNSVPNARAPTVPKKDADRVPIKHNFAEEFDRPPFLGSKTAPAHHNNGRRMMSTEGNPMFNKLPRENLEVRNDFLKKHRLTFRSDPVEFVDAFIPWEANPYGDKHFSLSQITTFTNTKARLANAGKGGTFYRDYQGDFTVKETRQHLGLYIWNGLSPSPRMDLKFQSQADDPVNGNDYIKSELGPGAERRHKHFRAFFAVSDPLKAIPDRKQVPLFKIQRLVRWINFISFASVNLGTHLAIDEQTMGFQGRHVDKLRINYKAEGDGFQCDAICEEGFTYAVHFRQEPPPKKYIDMGLSPLHSRVMWLIDQVKDKGHRIWMDNLYLSAKLCRASYCHEKNVLIAGVTRKNGRGLPNSVLQEEVKTKEAEISVRGTVKVAVLKGDANCPNVVAASVYDTKPVHFLSTICESIAWVVKDRQVFNVDTERMETLKFLRLNVNDDYNNDMGHTDIADQLRNNYKFDHWFRNFKWWWSIFMWGFGVLLVNAYITYKKVLIEAGHERYILSQYDFRRLVALEWVSSREVSINQRKRENQMNAARIEAIQKRHLPEESGDSGGRKKRRTNTPQSAESAGSGKQRAPKLTDLTIQSTYAKRLNMFVEEGHFPVEKPGQRMKCALHKWAANIEKRVNVYSCSCCKVALCVPCFKIFHQDGCLVQHKQKYKQQFEQEQLALKTPPTKKS